ncbi:MAG: hypothetical protein DMG40_15750 [Acidobacteria bacterium]|nr:MAG: hypothetical protein DMG40_15750 [Acidobacteriota bacterium]
MRLHQLAGIAGFFLAATLSVPAWACDTSPEPAMPGTINYLEGAVYIGSEPLSSKSIGSAELQTGESLRTAKGKAEILLTPGVFLRVDDNSSVRMISSSLTDTEVGLNQGHAMFEVAEIHPENDIRVEAAGETTRLLKTGLYDFDLGQAELRVFDGKVRVQYDDRHMDVKGGREVPLEAGEQLKARKFDKKSYYGSDLYRWSSLRSAYVAEANVNAAGLYAVNGWGPWGPGWWGFGWYWDPCFDCFTFIPGDGIFYSPFGWGFYSPWFVYNAPYYGVFVSGYHPGVRYHFSPNNHNWGPGTHYVTSPKYASGIYRGPGSSGGFHSGARFPGVRGFGGGGIHGGFRAGGGGFHGGGFHGGSFHGGGFHRH